MIRNPYIGMPLEIFMRDTDKDVAVSSEKVSGRHMSCGCGDSGNSAGDGDISQDGNNFDHMKLGDLPLAMSYVPWQKWGQHYTLEEGLDAGTIFPDLNLPFRGGMRR